MAKVSIDTEELYEHGKALGFIVAALIRGMLDGMEEFEGVCAELEEKQREEADKLQRIKQDNGDCAECWCDTCDDLEKCANLREGELPDGIRPFPCVGCAESMRFRPRKEERCSGYKERKAE